ncbi:MAG: DNRLRE domain-containing protein [Tenericutes bacterium]|nr:DNRLRE domain-containing protein [Mycoplasmatota bacterium]
MKEIEILDKRKEREKHFLKENGDIVAHVYDEDIHFLKDGKFEEIDNTLIDDDEYYTNKENAYKVWFNKNSKTDIMQMKINDHYINIRLKDGNDTDIIKNDISSKLSSSVSYNEILNNINFDYKVLSNKVKECIVLKDRDADIDKLEFIIDTDLELLINTDKTISALKDNNEIFKIDAPYMIDSNNNISNDISYELFKIEKGYILKFKINKAWLDADTTAYPVVIDPTITNSGQESSVYDTYIYAGDTGVDRNSKTYLKVGVERTNNVDVINRALLKFELPTIGTGSQVIDAQLTLRGYPDTTNTHIDTILNIHRVTQDWNETDATWSEMNDKYDSRVEGVFYSTRNYYYDNDGNIILFMASTDLTNLVKKWYADTPNYGILIKENKEVYTNDAIPMFFSKNNNVSGGNPKPLLSVTYRNQNGLETYMDYQNQVFTQGKLYQNNYNGNLTAMFDVGTTISGKLPVSLKWVYNTNDVILNQDIGCGIGGKFNLFQTVKQADEIKNEGVKYLKYLDEDGTIHYFLNRKVKYDETNGFVTMDYENTFYDEDGLDLVIERSSNNYVMKDKNNNRKKFVIQNGIGYLTEIIDVSENKITISYDSNNRIIKIIDANSAEINIVYATDKISIISPDQTVILNFNGACISSIVSSLGTTVFAHNKNNLISSITDITGKKIAYEYYSESPYRIKKVLEYGINNTLGNYYSIYYGYNATTIIDNKEKARTITFNNSGNPVSISSLKNHNDITNAYGIKLDYGETERGVTTKTNKLLSNQIPLKYVRNLLNNSSFEFDDIQKIDFLPLDTESISLASNVSHSGNRSLKIICWSIKGGNVYKSVTVPKGKWYTFSAYIKDAKVIHSNYSIQLYLSYKDKEGKEICSIGDFVVPTDSFEKYTATLYYPEDAQSELKIQIYFEPYASIYMDDIQLEEGEVANNYNMLENSGFENGMTGWTLIATDENDNDVKNQVFEVVNVNEETKALKVKMNPSNYSSFSQNFNVKGKAGDQYTISFWYKNEGFAGMESMGVNSYNNVSFNFNPVAEQQTDMMITKTFNPNEKEWQYFSQTFDAPWDFDSLMIKFSQSFNANNLYVTNLNLFRDVRSVTYEYDENGNIITSKNLNDEFNKFSYDKNNQLIRMTNPKGQNFTYEYDNIVTDRVLRGVSGTGISNEVEYDEFGNPIITRIISRGQMLNPMNGTYKIRLKGTNNSLKLINSQIVITNDICGHDKWILTKVTSNNIDYFIINHSIVTDKYLSVVDNTILLTSNQGDNSLFKLIKQDNGSYLIQSKSNHKYLKYHSNLLSLEELIENDENFEFYFESNIDGEFIENNAEYTSDGKYIKSITDTNFNRTIYDIDSITGLTKSITNSNGKTTNYTYNDKKQITSITNENRTVNYEYNNQNMLSRIIQGDRIYNFNYDEFLNIKNIKIGDNVTLITNNYEDNNGNLVSSTYGNNHIVNYEYDEYNRIKKLIKMNDIYHYYYGNNGDLLKIKSNDDLIEYIYDSAKRLYQHKFNQFNIKYNYDSNNNIINKNYKLNNVSHTIQNTLNDDDTITKVVLDNDEFNYNYDSLGRLASSNINNNFNTNYEYITNGKRTSLLVKSIGNNNDKYSYKYDKLNNITHIYHNGNLENRYYYDDYNELTKEDNYLLNKTIRYKYDDLGNLLFKKVYELNTYNQLKQDKYEYANTNWCDQLTKFNDDIITYDGIGNPLTIGEDITLNWINGRQLNSYTDSNNVITYKYNKDGIRTSKIINNVETKYYLEGSSIIIEKTGDNMLYYMYSNGELVGFKYNDNIYYYMKNSQRDIIGILDSNYNIIAKYTYDSWGTAISIADGNGNDVSNDLTHIANINPFRYRGYYYDKEINLYYLNSRYYNSVWGRFINADNYVSTDTGTLGYNMFIYCNNNWVNYKDKDGHGLFALAVVATVAMAALVVNTIKQKKKAKKEIEKLQQKQNVPDKTKEIDQMMKNNAQNLVNKTANQIPIQKLYTFAKSVASGSENDLKRTDAWEGETVSYRGMVLEAQDIGNLNFGYIGRAMGYDIDFLTAGAGIVQLYEHYDNPETYLNCFTSSLCDDPRDTYYIKLGAIIYDSLN